MGLTLALAGPRRKRQRGRVGRARKEVAAADVAKELLPGASPALLRALHLLTRDGALNADARRKLKQINHLIGFLRPPIEELLSRYDNPVLVDAGAGKSYLGFMIADLLLRPAGRGEVWAIETRPDLVATMEARAREMALPQLRPVLGAIESAPLPEQVHMVCALHACDTATDDALLLALRRSAEHVAVVPCCQAEVARQLEAQSEPAPFIGALTHYPLHRRELASQLTNVIRGLVLEAEGYHVTVTEAVGLEHSLKNELILGKRIKRGRKAAREALDRLLAESGVAPKLVRALRPM